MLLISQLYFFSSRCINTFTMSDRHNRLVFSTTTIQFGQTKGEPTFPVSPPCQFLMLLHSVCTTNSFISKNLYQVKAMFFTICFNFIFLIFQTVSISSLPLSRDSYIPRQRSISHPPVTKIKIYVTLFSE